jgi:hypothetical protein
MLKNKIIVSGILLSGLAITSALVTSSLLPSSVGTYNAWTPSTGSTHYTLVDESSCNGVTDYVRTTVTGSRDSFGVSLSSIPDGSTITAVAITPCASKNKSSGASTMNLFYRVNGSNSADAGSYSLSGTTPTSLTTTNFSGLSVIKNASTTFEVGAVYTSGTGGARLSNIQTVITYTPAAPLAPSGLSSSVITTGTSTYVSSGWVDNSNNETGFLIERSLDNVLFSVVASTTAGITSYNNFGVASGATYYYKVRAFNTGGFSAYSNTTSVTIP